MSKLSDDRRDHEADAGGFQQEAEGVGADQGGQAQSQVNVRKSKTSSSSLKLDMHVLFNLKYVFLCSYFLQFTAKHETNL